MLITFPLLFGVLIYLFYKSKDDLSLVDYLPEYKSKEENDLHNDLEDFFI